jgi:magnesium and cobalt transporter
MSDNIPSNPQANGTTRDSSLVEVIREWLRGLARRRGGETRLREILEEVIDDRGEEAIPTTSEERAMLLNLLNFGELCVADVMVPRANIVAVEQATPLAEVVRIMREAGHSRLPVFRDSLDNVIGMVHVRDLLRFWGADEPFALDAIARQFLFVPPSMPVRDLLLQMRATRVHMAMVVDEYGGTDGLVTIEDLVEEIVGEIQDEHDIEELPMLVEQPDGVIEADAQVPVADLESRIGCGLLPEAHEEHVETLGGLVFSLVGRVPVRGELITHPVGLRFEVIDADPRRIKRLRIHRAPPGGV